VLGVVGFAVDLGVTGTTVYNQYAEDKTEAAITAAQFVGRWGGALAGNTYGAAWEAALGTFVPVLGNVVGGIVGGVAGSIAGAFGGEWIVNTVIRGSSSSYLSDQKAELTVSQSVALDRAEPDSRPFLNVPPPPEGSVPTLQPAPGSEVPATDRLFSILGLPLMEPGKPFFLDPTFTLFTRFDIRSRRAGALVSGDIAQLDTALARARVKHITVA
jgi:hypothetical protein